MIILIYSTHAAAQIWVLDLTCKAIFKSWFNGLYSQNTNYAWLITFLFLSFQVDQPLWHLSNSPFTMVEYYQILGVRRESSAEDIKKAWVSVNGTVSPTFQWRKNYISSFHQIYIYIYTIYIYIYNDGCTSLNKCQLMIHLFSYRYCKMITVQSIRKPFVLVMFVTIIKSEIIVWTFVFPCASYF